MSTSSGSKYHRRRLHGSRDTAFDLIWIMESSEHFHEKHLFFERCARALKPGGVVACAAWLRDGPLNQGDLDLVNRIGERMLSASLDALSDYRRWMTAAGLDVTAEEDITRHVEPTWAHCSRIGENLIVRFLIRFCDADTQRFVRFPLMKQAYTQDAMAFGLFAGRKAFNSALDPTVAGIR